MTEPLLTSAIKVFMTETMYKAKKIKDSLLGKPTSSKDAETIKNDFIESIKESNNINYVKGKVLFTPYKVGCIDVENRIVMSPMRRCRAIGNIPVELMVDYYKQRSSAGLIITEGTSPSPNGLGYARMPGIFSKQQIEGWKLITSEVHKAGGKIVVQLMHSGRISHTLNMPDKAKILAPSAIKATGQMNTDLKQMQDFPIPKEMTIEDILMTIGEFVTASNNAMDAGFDGVELHGANGYLLEEFLSPVSNARTDEYGGTIENRCRFVIELVKAVAETIGKDKVGIHISPYGVANDMPYYLEMDSTYKYLSEELNKLDIAYIHLVDHSSTGSPIVPMFMKKLIRNIFKNTIILSGGYDKAKAELDIDEEHADLISFGRPFINNPDLVERLKNNWPLSTILHTDLFYSADEQGYTDYLLYKV